MKKLLSLLACLALASPALADPSPNASTYQVATAGITVPALPTDLACLELTSGSAQIMSIDVNGHAPTTAVTASAQIVKRSTHNTGGTPTAFTPLGRATSTPASTALLQAYTVVPTPLGTLVGLYDEADSLIQPASATTGGAPALFDFTKGSPLIISGTEAICVTVPSTASGFAGATLEVTFRIQQ